MIILNAQINVILKRTPIQRVGCFWKAFPMSNCGKFNSLYNIILYKSILSTVHCMSVISASRAWCTLFLPICKCSHCRSSHSSQSDFKLPIEIRGLCQVSRELSRTFFFIYLRYKTCSLNMVFTQQPRIKTWYLLRNIFYSFLNFFQCIFHYFFFLMSFFSFLIHNSNNS